MEKGMILFFARAKEDAMILGTPDVIKIVQSIGVSTIYVATSRDEVIDGWAHLTAIGTKQISCMTVMYNSTTGAFDLEGVPLMTCVGNEAAIFHLDQGVIRLYQSIYTCGIN